MTATVVHLVRHGEVENPDGILYGRLPGFSLSTRGRHMAKLTAHYLATRGSGASAPITHVVSSPLERAQQTAAPIAAAWGLDVTLDDRVLEADNTFEGTKVAAALRQPRHWPRLRNPRTPSWGEPYADIVRRMVAAVRAARTQAEGAEAVIVSHQLPIWLTYRAAEGMALPHVPTRRRCRLASVTSLHFAGPDLIGTTYTEPARALYTPEQAR